MQLENSKDSDPGLVTTVAEATATSSSSCPDTPASSLRAVAQRYKYYDLFKGGEVHKFVKGVLLKFIQDCASKLCEYFRREFEIIAD